MTNLSKIITRLTLINGDHCCPYIERCVGELEKLRTQLIQIQEDVSDICVEDLGMGYQGIDDARLDSLDDRFEEILYEEKST
tara:strand:+ start:1012 stop:1257 length:246 start_codon:yes stop_codon:yes gene_type:complete